MRAMAHRGIALVERLTGVFVLVGSVRSGLWAGVGVSLAVRSYLKSAAKTEVSWPCFRALGRETVRRSSRHTLSRHRRVSCFWASAIGRGVGGRGPLVFCATKFPARCRSLRPLHLTPHRLAERRSTGCHGRLPSRSGHWPRKREHPRGTPVSGCMGGPPLFPAPRYVAVILLTVAGLLVGPGGVFNGKAWWLTLWTLGGKIARRARYSRWLQLLGWFPCATRWRSGTGRPRLRLA